MGSIREQAIEQLRETVKRNEIHLRNSIQLGKMMRTTAWRNCIDEAYYAEHGTKLLHNLGVSTPNTRDEATIRLMAIELFKEFIAQLVDKGNHAQLLIDAANAEITKLGGIAR